MFSKKLAILAFGMVLIMITIALLLLSARYPHFSYRADRVVLAGIGPFQKIITESIRTCQLIWRDYFDTVLIVYENERLKVALNRADELYNQCVEAKLENQRLRELLEFKKKSSFQMVAAEVIGKDPSHWSKTITIDKGELDGLEEGFPVVVPKGIVGQVILVAKHYAKVLLIIDQNSAVDALIQEKRARGIVKGNTEEEFLFQYVLRKNQVSTGDVVVASGFDGIFPKGFRLGIVSGILKPNAGMFQEIRVSPLVDFEKLEEVFVFCKAPLHSIKK